MKNPMDDIEFLKELHSQKNRTVYARIISLTFDERPVEEIQGKITTGSINIDGASAVRRTCSLTLSAAADITITDFYWTLATKFKLEIGLENYIDSRYPSIIWFPQGIYLISTFSVSCSTNSRMVTIQGKDKMSLLNGELGGTLNSSIDFGKIDEIEYEYNSISVSVDEFKNQCLEVIVQNTSDLNPAFPAFEYKEDYRPIDSSLISKKRVENEVVYELKPNSSEYSIAKTYKEGNSYYEKIVEMEYITEIDKPKPIYYNNKFYIKRPSEIEDQENYLLSNYVSDYSYEKVAFSSDSTWSSGQYYLFNVELNKYYIDYGDKIQEDQDYFQKITPSYYTKDSVITTKDLPIKDIITEMLHEYGNEPYYNILINNLPEEGQELLEYRGETPMYLIHNLSDDTYNMTLDGSMEVGVLLNDNEYYYLAVSDFSFDELEAGKYYIQFDEDVYIHTTEYNSYAQYYYRVSKTEKVKLHDFTDNELAFFKKGIIENDNAWKIVIKEGSEDTRILGEVIKIEYGMSVGYRPTELTYAGELVAKAGETIASVLDKIKNMLGSYEYFYNLEGQFVFQEKKTFLNNSFSKLFKNDDTEFYDVKQQKYSFIFNDSKFFTNISNTPNIAAIKNNYTVWGERESVTGNKLPMHMVMAIMDKPLIYTAFPAMRIAKKHQWPVYNENGKQYQFTFVSKDAPADMVLSYINSNPEIEQKILRVDWRELIYQMSRDFKRYGNLGSEYFSPNYFIDLQKYNPGLCDGKNKTGYEPFYTDMSGFWRDLYNPFPESEIDSKHLYEVDDYFKKGHQYEYWSKSILYAANLNFWIDFIESDGELGKYSMRKIGSRPKAATDTKVSAINFREVPSIMFVEEFSANPRSGYQYIKFNNKIMDYFSLSSQGKDAETWINDAIYQNSIITETISLTSIPIYYLQPNTLIQIFNEDLKIGGEYIINRLTYSLMHNGTMNISAIKNQPYIV